MTFPYWIDCINSTECDKCHAEEKEPCRTDSGEVCRFPHSNRKQKYFQSRKPLTFAETRRKREETIREVREFVIQKLEGRIQDLEAFIIENHGEETLNGI